MVHHLTYNNTLGLKTILVNAKTIITFILKLIYSLLIWKDYVYSHSPNQANDEPQTKTKLICTSNHMRMAHHSTNEGTLSPHNVTLRPIYCYFYITIVIPFIIF